MRNSSNPAQELQDEGKLGFPSWYQLLKAFVASLDYSNSDKQYFISILDERLALIDELKSIINQNPNSFHPAIVYQLIGTSLCKNDTKLTLQELTDFYTKVNMSTNEFFTIMNMDAKDHIYVDPRIKEILGLEPEPFNVKALTGFDPENPLFHPEDLPHSMRMGALALMVISLPDQQLRSGSEYYSAKFRICTSASSNIHIRNANYVTIEKKGHILNEIYPNNNYVPTSIYYRVITHDSNYYNGIEAYFATSPERSRIQSNLLYLLNAYLLDIPPKQILMLEERRHADRYKAVSNRLNEGIQRHSKTKFEFEDQKVGDCFSKTIRPKIQNSIKTWEGTQPKSTYSDQDAVNQTRRLGLLPMPTNIRDLIYACINET